MAESFALGTITPSGNRTVERVVQAMLADLPGARPISRAFQSWAIRAASQATTCRACLMPRPCSLHALPDVISWNGTKGGALGFEVDRELTAEVTRATGLPASTSALAFLDALKALSARRIALVTPYDDAYQAKCIKAFAGQGFETVSERHSGLLDNFSYGRVPPENIAAMTRAAVGEVRPDAVIYFCTNFFGAEIAPVLEAELGVRCSIPRRSASGVHCARRAEAFGARAVGASLHAVRPSASGAAAVWPVKCFTR